MFFDVYKMLCDRAGVSPTTLAESLGISRGTVSGWRNSGYKPRPDATHKIAERFHVSEAYLMGYDTNVLGDLLPYEIEILGKQLKKCRTEDDRNVILAKIEEKREALENFRSWQAEQAAETKNAPDEGARELKREELKFALFGSGEITDAKLDEVLRYATYIKDL